MVALLRELRRERNGAVADSMRYYGTPYGLNYGVSLPTLRRIARAEAPDHGFARYLYRQDVRELRLAALHIACPACFTPEEFPAWAAGIVNSEIAEEAAFALLSRAEAFPALFSAWIASPDALLQYAALLAAARSPRLTASWVAPAVEAVHRNATAEATVETPAEATTEATAAAISAAADTSVAPGAFVFDTSVTGGLFSGSYHACFRRFFRWRHPFRCNCLSRPRRFSGRRPACRLPVCCRAAGFLPASGAASRPRRPPYGSGCGGAARGRRGAKRGEPAGGTPRSRFSG